MLNKSQIDNEAWAQVKELGFLLIAILFSGQHMFAQATHTLKPTPKTIAWGYYDAKTPPVQRSRDKTVWNYDGGVFFATDGSLPNGVCFRVSGRVTAPDFFDNLKREDTEEGTVFRRGAETVTQFPETLTVSYVIRDQSCAPSLENTGARGYLTPETMNSVHLSLYWKRGVELRAVKKGIEIKMAMQPVVPYAKTLAAELPKRFEWFYQLAVPSAGVPLSDSLVLLFRAPDGRVAARVAARM